MESTKKEEMNLGTSIKSSDLGSSIIKEEKFMRKTKGITLIALIITIIIMLILVAVTVSILINSGLLGKAKKAGEDYKTAYEKEQSLGESINIDGVVYNSIDEIVGSEVHNWTRNGDTLTCSHCNKTFTIGQTVNYTAGGTGASSITAEMSGLDKQAEYYDNNSIAVTQTINRDANTVWVVLGREDGNRDGNYETLLLTTATPTEDEITLYGAAAYNNWVSECNRIAKDLYGNNARGMTIEDVNECLQYTPAGGMYWDDRGNFHITDNLTTKLKDLSTWNNIKNNGTYTPDGTNTEEKLGDYEINGYYYYVDGDNMYLTDEANPEVTSHTITTTERNLIFGEYDSVEGIYSFSYWLASRSVSASFYFASFGPSIVQHGYTRSFNDLFSSGGSSIGFDLAFRAVVSLTSDIPE